VFQCFGAAVAGLRTNFTNLHELMNPGGKKEIVFSTTAENATIAAIMGRAVRFAVKGSATTFSNHGFHGGHG
jgi:hypothetical protein